MFRPDPKFWNWLRSDLRLNGLIIFIVVFMLALLLFNNIFQNPLANYDTAEHQNNVNYLAVIQRYPTAEESNGFFYPPLPYILPSIFQYQCNSPEGPTNLCAFLSAKVGQLQNVLLAAIAIGYLIRICDLIRPGDSFFKFAVFFFLAMMPVFFKTFSMMRGEPWLFFFIVLAIHKLLQIRIKGQFTITNTVLLGIFFSGMLLSRQWGALAILGIYAWIGLWFLQDAALRKTIAIHFFAAGVIGLLGGAWFYIYLYITNGTAMSFNRSAAVDGFALSNQPLDFYFGTSIKELITYPYRSTPNQLFPIYYSSFWGDYWGYFKLRHTGEDPALVQYLGRVNLVSFLPSLFFALAVLRGIFQTFKSLLNQAEDDHNKHPVSLLTLIWLLSNIGYLWFLIRYPFPAKGDGDTIKASYMLQTLPAIALLAGLWLTSIRQRYKAVAIGLLIVFFIVFIHNLDTLIAGAPGIYY